MKKLYKNVRVVDANTEREADVLVEDRVIAGLHDPDSLDAREYDFWVDGHSLTLMPGFTDMHSHLRDPGLTHKEDLSTGLAAAAAGGYTTVCAMANTVPVIDTPELVEANVDRAARLGLTRLIQVAAVTKGFSDSDLVDFPEIIRATRVLSNDGHNIDNPETMRGALKGSKEYGFIVATHNEPETETVERDIALLRDEGGRLHVCHISKADTLEAVRAAKEEGLAVTCEVTPHHLYASGLDFKVHPPFRTEADRLALLEGVRDGSIDAFGSDHAPHTAADKDAGSPGLINFETAFALYNTALSAAGIPLSKLSEMMSLGPARILGLPGGVIAAGEPADFVLVDPYEVWTVGATGFRSKSSNTPFVGEELTGRVHATVRGGVEIYNSGVYDTALREAGE